MMKLEKFKNPYFFIVYLKIALMFYIIPFLFVRIILNRILLLYSTAGWKIGTIGTFLTSRLHGVDQLEILFGGVWLIVFFYKIISFICIRLVLEKILQENKNVSSKLLINLTEEYRFRFRLRKLLVYENDKLLSPISVKRQGYIIVIPKKYYSEIEYRMILEHECNHIKQKDLVWRKIIIIAECINWYNPLVKWLSWQLIYHQEVCCDLQSISSRRYFTPKEYGRFLAGLSDNELPQLPLMAFCEKKSMLLRRLKMIKEVEQMKKPRRRVSSIVAICFIMITLILANALSTQLIKAEEKMIDASEVAVEVDMMKQQVLEEQVEYTKNDVEEIDMSEDMMVLSDMVSINVKASSDMRYLLGTKTMVTGNSIQISTTCEANETYRIGIKNVDTGKLTYVEGQGNLTHTFKITRNGKYSPYVENRGNNTIQIYGYVVYQY